MNRKSISATSLTVILLLSNCVYAGAKPGNANGTTSVVGDVPNSTSKIDNMSIGVVMPTFTAAAYNKAFYLFYNLSYPLKVRNVTTHLDLLTGRISETTGGYEYNAYRMLKIIEPLKQLLPKAKIVVLTDANVHQGDIFKQNDSSSSSDAYEVLILGHQEYVTQQEYDNLKKFVANGGILVFLDANALVAEVSYDKAAQTVTLVKGHDWAFNGHTAWRSVDDRWKNETSQWVGSNYYEREGIVKHIKFTNLPFKYTHHEEQYITNKRAHIIWDYKAVRAPGYVYLGNNSDGYHKPIIATYMQGYHKPIIATYEMDYRKGKVIGFGIYSDDVIYYSNQVNKNKFIRFLDRVLLKYI